MLELDEGQIQMGLSAAGKRQALEAMAAALVADGLVAEGYLDGLLARESQGSTYLGQGLAIPHGTPETRPLVYRTGVRLLHFPEGVDWGDGQRVHLAIGIAAKSDEHLRLLQMLTRALGDADLAPALRGARSAGEILALLQGTPPSLALDEQLIGLGVPAEDADELIWRGARLLRRADCVDNGFAAILQQREALPLGDGLWWLHSDQAVQRPGLAFVTPSQPLRHLGQPLLGLFCLASRGDAHQALLERVCAVLIEGRGRALTEAGSRAAVLAALGAGQAVDWPSAQVRLANPHGLHARPAQVLAQLAQRFAGDIHVRLANEGAAVSAKSLSKLLSLGARCGQALEFVAEPAIADEALPALVEAVRDGLGEAVTTPLDQVETLVVVETAEASVTVATPELPPQAPAAGSLVQAVAAAPGFASGPAYRRLTPRFDYAPHGESSAVERQRLEGALARVRADLDSLVSGSQAAAIRDIFAMHREILDDPGIAEDVTIHLHRGHSAEAAWHQVLEAAACQQERLCDALLAERAADLRDLARRVLARLCGLEEQAEPEQPYILVMEEVAPSDLARLDPARVAGILTARGGATSHSAIIARTLGIPALVGAGDTVLGLAPNTPLLLDGERGRLYVDPDPATRARLEDERRRRAERLERAHAQRYEPAVTRDGHRVEVCANLGDTRETAATVEQGAEGIGLLRTELVFMAHSQLPDLAAQRTEYRRVLDALAGRPLVVRTLDVGGDKPLPYWPMPAEENPFLGLRGIRLTLQRPDVMETQLRALLLAAGDRPLRIMFPMVGSLAEWRAARDMVQRLREEIEVTDLQLGIMVEVPSAALTAPVLAKEVDFFSIGTNDLTQYTLAIDRGHPTLSAQADGLHPAVLQLIDLTVRAAHAEGKWVGVCGELAADPLAVPLLVGLGVDELSVSARSVAEVKAAVRELDLAGARSLAQRALGLADAEAVRAFVEAG